MPSIFPVLLPPLAAEHCNSYRILNNDTSLLAEASTVAANVSNWDCSELITSSQSNYTAGTGYYIELTSVDGASVSDSP